MAIDTNLKYASIEQLFLDPFNPRLGRRQTDKILSQDSLMKEMGTWTLDELAFSYLENGGFWPFEPLLVVKEILYGDLSLVVVEGNRRLAALKYLFNAYEGNPATAKWKDISRSAPHPANLFSKIPYIVGDTRQEIQAFVGFRHVTGIKQWDANQKAGFIAKLIDEQGMSYEQVMKKIGSKTPVVRQHYVAYRLLLQMEDTVEEFDPGWAKNRFAVLYMSLTTEGAKKYLQINMMADPQTVKTPVPQTHLKNLANFSRWLFGPSDGTGPLVTDTRQVSSFGKILENDEAIDYLESRANPNWEVALRIAGGDEDEIIQWVGNAADNIELALMRAHLHKDSAKLRKAVERLTKDAEQLSSIFGLSVEKS